MQTAKAASASLPTPLLLIKDYKEWSLDAALPRAPRYGMASVLLGLSEWLTRPETPPPAAHVLAFIAERQVRLTVAVVT